MRKLFVAGDSYCYHRTDSEKHWPARLAQNLNLELHGNGYPGEGWWPTRTTLIDYLDNLHNTDLFVFCHTEPHRIISGNPNLLKGNVEEVKETYFKYIQSDDVTDWSVSNWYKELNELLKGKTVIHLQCFKHPQFSQLVGSKLYKPLLDISIQSAGGNFNLPAWGGNQVLKNMNEYENHFSPETNKMFADFLSDVFTNKSQDLRDGADLVYNN